MPKIDLPADVVAAQLDELAAQFGDGDTPALFRAIAFCGHQQIPMPEWAVAAYFAAMNRWWTLDCASLDDAFGVHFPKSKHLAAARKKRRLQLAVYDDVEASKASSRGISASLFAEVGKRHAIGKTLAEKYCYSAKRMLGSMPKSIDALLVPFMTPAAKAAASTRKISKLRGSRSKRR